MKDFDIDFPYKADVAKMDFDEAGYVWFHNDKDYFKYNGHQIDQVGLIEIIGKKNDDYYLYSKIIFQEERILFINGKSVCSLNPSTKTMNVVWELPGQKYVKYLYQDEADNIWVFSSTWDNKKQPVYKSTDGKHFEEVFDMNDHIGEQGVFWTYYELDDKDGHLYFLWRKGDMLILDYEGNEVELELADKAHYIKTKSCAQFRLDNRKRLWRIYNSEFEIYDEQLKSFQKHELSGRFEFVTNCKIEDEKLNKRRGLDKVGSMLNMKYIFVDHKDRIWMACAASYLICYNPATKEVTNFRQALVNELGGGDGDIEKLLEDDSNNLWGFKKGGIFKIREIESYFDSYLVNTKSKDHPFHAHNTDPTYQRIIEYYNDYAIRNSSIHSINEDAEGRLIFQEGVFTFRLDPVTEVLELLPVFAPKESVHIAFNESLKIFGVWNSYYKLNDDFTPEKMKAPLLKLEYTFAQKNGDLWASGLLSMKSYLFAKMNNATNEFDENYLDPSGEINFSINKVMCMDEDEQGNLWLATLEGLVYFNVLENKFEFYGQHLLNGSDSTKIAEVVTQVEYLENGLMWIVTNFEIGLLDSKTKSIIHYLPFDEKAIEQGVKLVNYGDSVVWLGHSNGLFYHNFNTTESVSVSSEEGIFTEGAVHALRRMNNGQIAVGTNNGLYIFHPDSLLQTYSLQREYQQSIPLSLNGYSYIDGKTDSLRDYKFIKDTIEDITLDYNDKMLSFDFVILNFNYPDRHLYSYKLDGYDIAWSQPEKENKVKYTSLPAGNYTFKVRATSGSGIWSENIISIPVQVNQAWFYSWWFILSVIGLFTLITYLFTRYYYKEQLEKRLAIEKLRTKISNDLHDDVGSILSGLAAQSEVMSMTSEEKNKNQLLDISAQCRIVMEKLRDIVWAMNSERDKFENLMDRMQVFAAKQFEHSTMNFEIDLINIKGQNAINPDVRQNFYFIFKEAVTNAIKHSNGDLVKISLYKEEGKIILSIKDNGHVLPQISSEGIGLSSIKSRAKMMNGEVFFNTLSGYEVKVVI